MSEEVIKAGWRGGIYRSLLITHTNLTIVDVVAEDDAVALEEVVDRRYIGPTSEWCPPLLGVVVVEVDFLHHVHVVPVSNQHY